MRGLILLFAFAVFGCGEGSKNAAPDESKEARVEAQPMPPRVATKPTKRRTSLGDVLSASTTCRGLADDMIKMVANVVFDRSAALKIAEKSGDACIADRLAILNLDLGEPAETACIRITNANVGAIGAIERWVETPGTSEENAARRAVVLIGEAEKECGIALAR